MLNQNDFERNPSRVTIQLKQAFQVERAEAAILIKRDRKNKTAETSGKRELKNAITTA